MFKKLFYITLAGIILMLTGCYDQLVSWSPDGRYILYSIPDETTLWRWDSKTGKAEEIKLLVRKGSGKPSSKPEILHKEIMGSKYISGGTKAAILTTGEELYLLDFKTGLCELVDDNVGSGFYASEDDETLYYVRQEGDKGKEIFTLIEYKNSKKTSLFSQEEEFLHPCVSPDGNYILYGSEHALGLYDLKEKKSIILLSDNEGGFVSPRWVNRNEIVYIYLPASDNEYGTLYKASIDLNNMKISSTPQVLKEGISPLFSISITDYSREIKNTENRESSTLQKTEPVATVTMATQDKDIMQAAVISINTGEIILKSDVLSSAVAPTLSPDGKYLAYLSGRDDYVFLIIRDLKTGNQTRVWRNKVEKLFVEAEDLTRAGEFKKALDKYNFIIKEFPDSKILKDVYLNLANLPLKPEVCDLDDAYGNIEKAGDFNNLPPKLMDYLWRPEDRIAVDPPEDWIQTYGTEKSREIFKFNTDLTRDLRGLWMREGKKYLYIRIDYGSNRDLTGLTFQDTLLLFEYNAPDHCCGSQDISKNVQWDRKAHRKVLIRHWYKSGTSSQYDLEILDSKDNPLHRCLVSGFEVRDNPYFKFYQSTNNGSHSVIYAISREINALYLQPWTSWKKVNIQVCTFKGGIESQRKAETPRFEEGKDLIDIADTFGEENNIERIKADKKENPDKPVVIKGYAGTLELKK